MTAQEVKDKMNFYTHKNIDFLWGVDYELHNGFFILNPLKQTDILFDINGICNYSKEDKQLNIQFKSYPTSIKDYNIKFNIVKQGLLNGNSFLTNLTIKTPITTNLSLKDIFIHSKAKYKLLIDNKFVCFSPEQFVNINNGKIYTFPMKGTINATLPNAKQQLLNNYKELCEHNTIVDLMRNDIGKVAHNIKVENFRFIDTLSTLKGNILQTSSKITGTINKNTNLGDIIFALLPAGSISGAPKSATINIIRQAEQEDRGYYTGVFGYYDGKTLDSAVLIRSIENNNGNLYYRSGGGITIHSTMEEEYNEANTKVYLSI